MLVGTLLRALNIIGLLHIGASFCQEQGLYTDAYGLAPENIIWVEANPAVVEKVKREKGIQTIHQAVLSDSSGVVDFYITNNDGLSSSILPLYAHKFYHPNVRVESTIQLATTTLSAWIDQVKLDPRLYECLVLDIQGAELKVLRGSPDVLTNVKIIHTEINVEELYRGCGLYDDLVKFLDEHGFQILYRSVNEFMWGDAVFVRKGLVR